MGEVVRIALFGLDERMTAARAYQVSLVSEVVPRDQLRYRAAELARRLAAKPPMAVQGTVKAIWDSLHMSASGGRDIPLHYPQIGNPLSKLDFEGGQGQPYERR